MLCRLASDNNKLKVYMRTMFFITDLKPAVVHVQLFGLEAQVRIEDKCHLECRRADSYIVKFCRYNKDEKKCLVDRKDAQNEGECYIQRSVRVMSASGQQCIGSIDTPRHIYVL